MGLQTRDQTGDRERRALWRAAATLGLKRRGGKAAAVLPVVFFVTDPQRTPDPVSVARTLPRGTGVVFRGFGRPDAESVARALAGLARRRGLILLIGADEGLAAKVGAHGLHLPERDLHRARSIRHRRRGWLITGAVHSPMALARVKGMGLDAVLVSTVFPSKSRSAGRPLGPVKLAFMMRCAGRPVIALGGVNGRTAARLVGTGVSGFAAVDGLL